MAKFKVLKDFYSNSLEKDVKEGEVHDFKWTPEEVLRLFGDSFLEEVKVSKTRAKKTIDKDEVK